MNSFKHKERQSKEGKKISLIKKNIHSLPTKLTSSAIVPSHKDLVNEFQDDRLFSHQSPLLVHPRMV